MIKKRNGDLLSKLLNQLKLKHEIFIKEVRSKGLMAAIEFKNNHDALKVYNKISSGKDGLVQQL